MLVPIKQVTHELNYAIATIKLVSFCVFRMWAHLHAHGFLRYFDASLSLWSI